MLRYAFVTTARHDGKLRYAWGGVGWGGVGCDSIRHYCKIWCDATLRIRLYCKTWCDATLRIRHYCKTWWDATLRMGWGGVGWGVIAFVTTARYDVMLRYAFVSTGCGHTLAASMATGKWCKSQFQTAFVPKSKANAMVCCSNTFEVTNGDGNTLASTCLPPLAKL